MTEVERLLAALLQAVSDDERGLGCRGKEVCAVCDAAFEAQEYLNSQGPRPGWWMAD